MNYPHCDNNEELYHTTRKENLKSIFTEGLLMKHVDVDNLVLLNYEFMKYEDEDYTMKEARDTIGKGFIFASADPDQYDMMENPEDYIILGIVKGDKCSYKFREEEINALGGEWISSEDIPPKCLCIFDIK